MEFRCFNGMRNCDYCGSCHSEFKARTSDEKRRIYNQVLEDFANKLKSKPYYDNEHNFQAIPIDFIDEVLDDMKVV